MENGGRVFRLLLGGQKGQLVVKGGEVLDREFVPFLPLLKSLNVAPLGLRDRAA